MAHPMASQSASSVARRMKAIGGKGASAGKSWGSTAMASKTGSSYPSKNAGSQVPYFAEGGSVGARPDRMARGGKKGGKKKGHTTNVVVNIPPSGGPPIGAAPGMPPGPPPAPPIPIQVPRAAPPVAPGPMPVPGPGPMPMAGPPGLPVRPPIPPPGIRPPGMKRGGSVKRFADGGFTDVDQPLGRGGPEGFSGWSRPDIPAQTVGARPFKKGGSVKLARGGLPGAPLQPQGRPTTPPGQEFGRAPGLPVQASDNARAALAARPALPAQAQGVRPFKKGGAVRAQLGAAIPPVPARPAVPVRRPVVPPAAAAASPVAKVVGLARRGAAANKAAVNRQAVRDVRDAGPRPLKDGGKSKADGGKVEKMADGGSIKQGGDGTKQYGEGRGYPVMKHGNSGLGRLEKIKKVPV